MFTATTGHNVGGKLLARFKVSRQVLMQNSPKFETMLDPNGNFAEAKQKIVDLKNNSSRAIELWFRLFHDKLNDETYKLPLKDLRAVIECHREHLFHLEKLNAWFATWMKLNGGKDYGRFSLDALRQLLYPCQEFDHAEGFMYATKKLAYETPGHIREDLSIAFGHLHLEPRIISSINAARGSLKMKIYEALYINKQFLDASCECRKEGLFAYETALHETGVWPLEKVLHGKHSMSMQQVIDGFARFTYEPPNDSCELCSSDLGATTVAKAIENAQKNFDGLCLDCIDNPRRRDWDFEYFQHHVFKSKKLKRTLGCRVDHDEPSWYYSWMARKQRADVFERERESRQRKADEMD